MPDTLEEALKYAETNPTWLARPVQLLRYITALAAEVIRLRVEVDIWKQTANEVGANLENELANQGDKQTASDE